MMNRRDFTRLALAATGASLSRRRLYAQAAWQTPAGTMVPILTHSFDNNRSGVNAQETVLTRAAVVSRGVKRLFTIPVWGDARGTECQPLILPNVKVKDGSTQDVLLLPNMANNVRAVVASTGAAIWDITLGRPVDGSNAIDFHNINQHWGVLSTGVIDPDSKLLYCVPWISTDGTPQNAVHFMAVIRIADGTLACPLVSMKNLSDGQQTYLSAMRKQRSSLCMTSVEGKKMVFFASGTVLETGNGASGWVFAFDCASNQFSAALALSQGRGAGVWMAGQGVAADAEGNLYATTGNGSFNGFSDFGEAVIKLQYTPPAAGGTGKLVVADRWAPYSDAGRIGQNPQLSSPTLLPKDKMAGMSGPSQEITPPVGGGMSMSLKNARVVKTTDQNTGQAVELVYPKSDPKNAAWDDEDFGSAGGTLIEKYGVYLAAGKDGIAYPVKSSKMGSTQPSDFANPKANCAKLAGPPVWFTASPGPVDPCPTDFTTLNFMPWGKTRHLHSTPVQYWHPTRGLILFAWGENSQLHAWTMSSSGQLAYLAQSAESASAENTNSPGGMPGGFMSLSSNGNAKGTALLWASIPYGDANAVITNGRFLCYDPDPDNYVTVNGSKQIPVLWDSQRWNVGYTHNKFNIPVVSGGKIFLPNYSGGVDVYGLA